MEWINKNQVDTDKYYGFIYEIEYTDGIKYIGKKSFFSHTNKAARQDGKPRKFHHRFYNKNVKRKRVKYEEIKTPSDWETYNGSTKLADDKIIKSKTIIRLCEQEIDLTYWEIYFLMINNVLFTDKYLNQAVGRNYYAGRLTHTKKWIKEKDTNGKP